MNHAQFARYLAAKTGRDHRDTAKFLREVRDAATEVLASGDKVTLLGLGSLTPQEKPPRVGRNPRTGEAIHVQSRTAAKWRPAKPLLDRLNGRR